jgi:DUF4097 and DUF4098 domain-containing protein YvlB
MMGFLRASFVMLLLTPVLGAQESTRTVSAAANARVKIDNPSGPTTVIGWDRNEVQVTARGSRASRVEVTSNTRRVEIDAPHGASLTVHVPRGAMLNVDAASGTVRIQDVTNSIEVEAGGGSVAIEAVARSIVVASFAGSVQIRGGGTEITRVESASGAVVVTQARGVVDVSSTSGSVSLAGQLRDAKLFSVSGSVSFSGAIENGGRLSAETSNGTVSLKLPASTPATYDLSTVNGSIHNAFGPQPDPRTGRPRDLKFTVQGGGARIKASSVNGSVMLAAQ